MSVALAAALIAGNGEGRVGSRAAYYCTSKIGGWLSKLRPVHHASVAICPAGESPTVIRATVRPLAPPGLLPNRDVLVPFWYRTVPQRTQREITAIIRWSAEKDLKNRRKQRARNSAAIRLPVAHTGLSTRSSRVTSGRIARYFLQIAYSVLGWCALETQIC